jgi:mono/diheme cytochrome c family protein
MNARRALHCLVAASCIVGQAFAGAAAPVPPAQAYRQECAGCHLAYPPRLLPAASWERILSNLPHHFGTDASLEEPQVRAIGAWLARESGGARSAPPEDRITRSAWFLHEHDEVPAATWKRASIRSASNCAACHTRADQGDFNEHTVRIPR